MNSDLISSLVVEKALSLKCALNFLILLSDFLEPELIMVVGQHHCLLVG